MDHERLASELLRALRGRRSQAALARLLGYRANVAHTWERGSRFPDARVLFRLAALNRCSFEAIARFPGARLALDPSERTWSPRSTAALLRALVGKTSLVELAGSIAVDRTTVGRWLSGTTEPRVPQLLALVDVASHRLVEFVALFVDPASLPSLHELARDLAAQRRMAYEVPWSHAVLRALELDAYRSSRSHVPGFIARAIGLDPDSETRLLAELRAARLIRRQRGKWVSARVLTVDTRSDPERDRQLKLHWAGVALERLQRGTLHESFHSYNLCNVSREDLERIRELHLEYFERVRRIVAESTVAERVVLLMQQLVPLDELPERGPLAAAAQPRR